MHVCGTTGLPTALQMAVSPIFPSLPQPYLNKCRVSNGTAPALCRPCRRQPTQRSRPRALRNASVLPPSNASRHNARLPYDLHDVVGLVLRVSHRLIERHRRLLPRRELFYLVFVFEMTDVRTGLRFSSYPSAHSISDDGRWRFLRHCTSVLYRGKGWLRRVCTTQHQNAHLL